MILGFKRVGKRFGEEVDWGIYGCWGMAANGGYDGVGVDFKWTWEPMEAYKGKIDYDRLRQFVAFVCEQSPLAIGPDQYEFDMEKGRAMFVQIDPVWGRWVFCVAKFIRCLVEYSASWKTYLALVEAGADDATIMACLMTLQLQDERQRQAQGNYHYGTYLLWHHGFSHGYQCPNWKGFSLEGLKHYRKFCLSNEDMDEISPPLDLTRGYRGADGGLLVPAKWNFKESGAMENYPWKKREDWATFLVRELQGEEAA